MDAGTTPTTPEGGQATPVKENGLQRALPILRWLPTYQRAWLRLDVVAGLTIWGLLIPEGIAYAALAGLPAQAGLYTLLASLVAYAIFGSSRHLVVAGTSASAILVASTVTVLALQDQTRYLALAAALILCVGVLFLLAWLFRLGFITQFLSRPIMAGFIFGLAIFVMVSQLPKLFGIAGGEGNTLEKLLHLLQNLGQTNVVTLVIGVVALALLFGIDRFAPRIPGGLVVLALGILVGTLWSVATTYGVAIVGPVPAGLPTIHLPQDVRLEDYWVLLPSAAGIVLVIFSEAVGTAQDFAQKHGYEIDTNQDLLAFAVANLGSAVLGGLAAGGSTSQTAVNDGAGARTQLSTLVAAALALVTIIALTFLFTNLPEAVLAALIIHAVSHLLKVREMRRFFALERSEFWLGMVALLGVILIDVLPGLIIAVVASLILVIYQASRPETAILGKVPGTSNVYTAIDRHPENQAVPGVLIFRLDAPLRYVNASVLRDRVRELVHASAAPVHYVVLDLSATDQLDITSAEMLQQLVGELSKEGVKTVFAEVHQPVRDMMWRLEEPNVMANEAVFPSVDAAVRAWQSEGQAIGPA